MEIKDHPQLFARVAESLLGSKFICAYSDEEAFEYLQIPAYAEPIDRYMRPLGRTLTCTADGAAFFLSYLEINTPERRASIKHQFKEVVNNLEPLVRILTIVQSARLDDSPLMPGDQLRQGELLTALENTPALKEDLSLLTRAGLFKTTQQATREQLTVVLESLVKAGYLRRNTITGSDYTALGRWSYLYEVMDFISSHEDLAAGEERDTQESLL